MYKCLNICNTFIKLHILCLLLQILCMNEKTNTFSMTKQEQMYPIISALSAALENCIVSIILRTFFFLPPRDIKI